MPAEQPVVLITGASEGGIGFALALAFASHNCRVFASARSLTSLAALPASIERIELQVTDPEACERAVREVERRAGRIDLLVNNAGAGATGPVVEFDVEQARKVFDTNVFAPMRLTQLVVPGMAERKTGLIINIGSVTGQIPTPWTGVYNSSKAALHSWTNTLRMEVKGLGINVMLVVPGTITSKFGKKQLASFTLPENSLYASVSGAIKARAELSQNPRYTTPAAVLAAGIVSHALSAHPAQYYTVGGMTWVVQVLEYLPRWLTWWLLGRVLGSDKVGKA